MRRIGIEVAGGLVRQNQLWAVHQRAGDGDALQFSTGQLPRENDLLCRSSQQRPASVQFVLRHASAGTLIQQQGQGDVLAQRQMRQDVKCLEYEAEFLAPEPGRGIVVQRGYGDAVNQYFTRDRVIQAGNQVQQS